MHLGCRTHGLTPQPVVSRELVTMTIAPPTADMVEALAAIKDGRRHLAAALEHTERAGPLLAGVRQVRLVQLAEKIADAIAHSNRISMMVNQDLDTELQREQAKRRHPASRSKELHSNGIAAVGTRKGS